MFFKRFFFLVFNYALLTAQVAQAQSSAQQQKDKSGENSKNKNTEASTSLENIPEAPEETLKIPTLPQVNPALPHRGSVAFLGPYAFSEQLDFDPVQSEMANFKLDSSVRGFSAGLLLGSQFNYFNLGLNLGLMGGFNQIKNSAGSPITYSSSGLLLGAIVKPYALVRLWKKIELGPVTPVIVRYASYGSSIEGTIISNRLKVLYAGGLRLAFDWGRTRFNADAAFFSKSKKYLSIEFQFEL